MADNRYHLDFDQGEFKCEIGTARFTIFFAAQIQVELESESEADGEMDLEWLFTRWNMLLYEWQYGFYV